MNSEITNNSHTMLTIALRKGDVEVVKRLIDAGIDVNCIDSYTQTTPLTEALRIRHIECAKLLINAGADVNLDDPHTQITPLIEIAQLGYTECVQLLIDAGANVNHKTRVHKTALLVACQGGHTKCAEALLAGGADVNPQVDGHKNIPLFFAIHNCNQLLVDCLIKAGADVNHKNIYGETALIFAAGKRRDKSVKALIQAGADVNHAGADGYTALIKSVMFGHDQCVKSLIEAGADVNHSAGISALQFAITKVHTKCLTPLLEGGAHAQVCASNNTRVLLPNYLSQKTYKLLHAAGFTVNTIGPTHPFFLLKSRLEEELNIRLEALCRKTIRKHLLQMSPMNLFVQVTQLGLPTALQKYLLHGVSLDDYKE